MLVFLGHWAIAVEGMTTRRTNEDKRRHRQFTKRLLVTTYRKYLYAVCKYKYTNSCRWEWRKNVKKSAKRTYSHKNPLTQWSCSLAAILISAWICLWENLWSMNGLVFVQTIKATPTCRLYCLGHEIFPFLAGIILCSVSIPLLPRDFSTYSR